MGRLFRFVGLGAVLFFVSYQSANAQGVCSNTANASTLYCTPVLAVNGPANLQFVGSTTTVIPTLPSAFSALNAGIATQISLVPTPSPASVAFSFGSGGLTVQRDLGPIFAPSSATIGKHRLYVASTYQFFEFDRIDQAPFKQVPLQLSTTACAGGAVGCTANIATLSSISVKANEYTAEATFGILGWLDASVILPIVNTRMSVVSTCSTCFQVQPPGSGTLVFLPNNSSARATGIGDLQFRFKAMVLHGEHGLVLAGVDVRTPTGNDLNFLGTGAVGAHPFAAAAYRSRIAPHASIGYTANGSSVIATSTQTGSAQLPNSLDYEAGVDVGITNSLGVVADYLGQTYFSANRIYVGTRGTAPDISCNPSGTAQCQSTNFSTNSFALGAKLKAFRSLIASGNVLFKLDDNGLHYKPSPMLGLSYTF